MTLLGWATVAFVAIDWFIAHYLHSRSEERWARYERFSAPVNFIVYGAWVVFAELPLWVDALFVSYMFTQYIGYWYVSGGKEKMEILAGLRNERKE